MWRPNCQPNNAHWPQTNDFIILKKKGFPSLLFLFFSISSRLREPTKQRMPIDRGQFPVAPAQDVHQGISLAPTRLCHSFSLNAQWQLYKKGTLITGSLSTTMCIYNQIGEEKTLRWVLLLSWSLDAYWLIYNWWPLICSVRSNIDIDTLLLINIRI